VQQGHDEGLPGEVGVHAAHQGDVDLDDLRPELNEVVEVGHARSGVVDGQTEARTKCHEGRSQRAVIVHVIVLGDLEDDWPGPGSEDRAQLVAIRDEPRRDVQAEEPFGGQRLRLRHGRAQCGGLELSLEAASTRLGEHEIGRGSIVKSSQRLVPDRAAAGEIDHRLEDRMERRLGDDRADPAPRSGSIETHPERVFEQESRWATSLNTGAVRRGA
jgi:hypothetical protein